MVVRPSGRCDRAAGRAHWSREPVRTPTPAPHRAHAHVAGRRARGRRRRDGAAVPIRTILGAPAAPVASGAWSASAPAGASGCWPSPPSAPAGYGVWHLLYGDRVERRGVARSAAGRAGHDHHLDVDHVDDLDHDVDDLDDVDHGPDRRDDRRDASDDGSSGPGPGPADADDDRGPSANAGPGSASSGSDQTVVTAPSVDRPPTTTAARDPARPGRAPRGPDRRARARPGRARRAPGRLVGLGLVGFRRTAEPGSYDQRALVAVGRPARPSRPWRATCSPPTTASASGTSAATSSSPAPCWPPIRTPRSSSSPGSPCARRGSATGGSASSGCPASSRTPTAPTATTSCRSPTPSAQRAPRFAAVVAAHRPDVVVVDRHPFGIAGELRPGLARGPSRRRGHRARAARHPRRAVGRRRRAGR